MLNFSNMYNKRHYLRWQDQLFTLDDYTEELEALAESLLGAACRHAREDGGAGFPGALVPRPCEELERYRGGGAAEPVPRGETLSLVRALAHEACQFRAFRASLDGGRRSRWAGAAPGAGSDGRASRRSVPISVSVTPRPPPRSPPRWRRLPSTRRRARARRASRRALSF